MNCDLAMDLPRTWDIGSKFARLSGEAPRWPSKINQGHTRISIEKRTIDGGEKANKVVEFHV